MTILKRLLLLFLLIACGLGVLAYSWTYTPQGRLDMPAAVMAKLLSLGGEPLELSPSDVVHKRKAANAQMGVVTFQRPFLFHYPIEP